MKPKHICKWRELKRLNDAGKTIRDKEGSMFVYCIVDAKTNFEKSVKEGRGRLRYPSTNHLELLSPAAAKEFRRQRRLGIEPQFDNEGLVPVVLVGKANQRKSARKTRELR